MSKEPTLDDLVDAELKKAKIEVHSAADASQVRQWVSTGNYALNWAISGRVSRGWPVGHMGEIYGDPYSGKSYLIARAIAAVQEQPNSIVFLDDTERAFNPDWARRLRVIPERVRLCHSQTIKDHADKVEAFLSAVEAHKEKIGVALFALDSFALLSTEHEQDKRFEKRDMTRAQEARKFFRIYSSRMGALPVLYLQTNHVIANVADPFSPRDSGGGGGSKYQSGVRLDLYSPSRLKHASTGDIIGVAIHATCTKTRFTVPWRKVKFVIPFYQSLNPYSGLLPILLQLPALEVAKNKVIVYQDEETAIKYVATDLLKQDAAAQALVERHPDILGALDEYYAEQENAFQDQDLVDMAFESDE